MKKIYYHSYKIKREIKRIIIEEYYSFGGKRIVDFKEMHCDENVSFQVEFQILDNVVITEKQQLWKLKFVSMDIMRLLRKALDKLKERDNFWNDYKCFERSYGLTILSDDEYKHLTLFPLATAPCQMNCLLFHQHTGYFRNWFSLERLIELSEGIQHEIEYFLHKKIPTTIKYPIHSRPRPRPLLFDKKPVIRVFQEQEQEEFILPFVTKQKIELDMMDMEE